MNSQYIGLLHAHCAHWGRIGMPRHELCVAICGHRVAINVVYATSGGRGGIVIASEERGAKCGGGGAALLGQLSAFQLRLMAINKPRARRS